MSAFSRLPLLCLIGVLALTACAQPQAPSPAARESGLPAAAPRASEPKRITVAVSTRDPAIFRSSAGGPFGGSVPGIDSLEDLVNAGMSIRDDGDILRPQLGEAVPGLSNGLWKLQPDGRMETTWKVRPNAKWQDGTPFTSADLAFTLQVGRDADMVAFSGHVGFDIIDGVTTPDPLTAVVMWKTPFIEADSLFTTQFAMPMPRHLLEKTYLEDKESLINLPYWNQEFIGAGPFRLKDWLPGSYLVLTAFDQYVLGRPKIDEVTVQFIPDSNTLVANMLTGDVDANLGRGMSLEQAVQLRDGWKDGRMEIGLVNWVVIYPQFINPNPAVMLDVRFRKALMHALDRQEMVDTLQGGLTKVGHAIINTELPNFKQLEPQVVRYSHDVRRAGQFVEEIGYTRGADGMFRDASGQPLRIEIRTTAEQDIQMKSMFAAADYWQRAGVGVDTMPLPSQRQRDREYRASRPGFELLRTPDGAKGLRRSHGSETPLPENSFGKSGNNARYMNPAFDALLDRYFATVPERERMEVLGQILHHQTDQVTVLGLFYAANPTVMSNRLVGMRPRNAAEGTEAWNSHEWDLK